MANVTYKTVISKAITDFNSIQDSLRTIGAVNGTYLIAASGTSSPVASTTLSSILTNQLSLKASGSVNIATLSNPSDGYYSISGTRSVSIPVSSSETVNKDIPYQTIKIRSGVATAPATISGTSASASTSGLTVTLSKTISVTPSVSTEGWIKAGTAGNSSVSLSGSISSITVPANGSFAINGGAGVVTSSKGGVTINGTNGKTVSVTGGTTDSPTSVTVTDANGFLKNASCKNTKTTGVTYTDGNITVNTTDKKLYIDAGYIGNVYFDLGTLIPDIDGDASDSHILNGKTAYDEAGNVITGSMANNGKVTSTITTQGGTYTIPVGYHDGTGVITASLSATSRTKGNGSCSLNDSANVTTSDTNNGIFVKFAGNGTVSTGTGYITAGSTTSNTAYSTKYITAITVPTTKSFTLTTSANTTTDASTISITNGKLRNISITNSANTTTDASTISITNGAYRNVAVTNSGILTANGGAGTSTGGATISSKTVSVTKSASSEYSSVTVTDANGFLTTTTLSAGDGSCTLDTTNTANVTTSDTNNGIKVTFKGSGIVTAGTGWNSTTSKSSSVASLTKYITGITVPTAKNFTLTTTANSTTDTSIITITNGAYRTLKINGGNADKGVLINGTNGKTVTVDTVTVTDANGDLTTTSRSASTGTCWYDSSSGLTFSNTNDSGISISFKGKGTVSTGTGWITSGSTTSNDSSAATKYITGVTVPSGKTFNVTNNGTVTGLYSYDSSTNTLTLK